MSDFSRWRGNERYGACGDEGGDESWSMRTFPVVQSQFP